MRTDYLFDSSKNNTYLLVMSRYDSSLNTVMKDLNIKELEDGELIVDQLITKGNNSKRFLKFDIKNYKIDFKSQTYIEPDVDLLARSIKVLSKIPAKYLQNVYPRRLREEIICFNS